MQEDLVAKRAPVQRVQLGFIRSTKVEKFVSRVKQEKSTSMRKPFVVVVVWGDTVTKKASVPPAQPVGTKTVRDKQRVKNVMLIVF